jgi:hypothetical protein
LQPAGKGDFADSKTSSRSTHRDHKEQQSRLRRQNLIRDCKLLELIVHFNSIVYSLICVDERNLSADRLSRLSQAERKQQLGKYSLPPLVKACCISGYELVRLAVKGNTTSAVRLLSISGVFLSLINHETHQLFPPIETILVASKSPKVISSHDLQHLMKQMRELYLVRDDAAQHILSLLTVMCSPIDQPNKPLQDIALQLVFPADSSETGGVLFSSSFLDEEWQLMMRSPVELREAFVSREECLVALEGEFCCLLEVFSRYNSNEDALLDKIHLIS